MPFKEIKFDDLVFDIKVQTYCNNPKFRCPNYGHSWACPPESPFLKETVSEFKKFYLIYYQFNLKEYVEKERIKNPKRSEKRIKESFYREEFIRDYLEQEIIKFIRNYETPYDNMLILWDGYCRICYKERKQCTYDQKQPCRYPEKIRYSMEACGIDVNATVKKVNIELEWPPVNYSYRFGLVCYK